MDLSIGDEIAFTKDPTAPEASPKPILTAGEYEEVFPSAEYEVEPILPKGSTMITIKP
jgi:hypothetical protein